MATEDIKNKVKSDNVLAQRFRCGGCQRSLAQVEDFATVTIKGKRRANDTAEAIGFLCSDCQKNERISKEGPRQAVYADDTGDIHIDFIDNLVDMQQAEAAPTTATTSEDKPKAAKK